MTAHRLVASPWSRRALVLAGCGSSGGTKRARSGRAGHRTRRRPPPPAGVDEAGRRRARGHRLRPGDQARRGGRAQPGPPAAAGSGTLAVRRTVPLPGDVRHLQLGRPGGPVLVPAESANQIVQVALPGGATTANDVRQQPHDAAEARQRRRRRRQRVRQVDLGRARRQGHPDDRRPQAARRGHRTDGDTVGVVDVGAFTLSTYDLATLTPHRPGARPGRARRTAT